MRNLYIFLVFMLLSCLSSFAKNYTPAEIDAILKENASLKSEILTCSELSTQLIASIKENTKLKSALKKAGLFVDKKTSEIKISKPETFMSACNVVLFSEEEFASLSDKKLELDKELNKELKKEASGADFREANKSDYTEKSKNFWRNVIY